MVPTRQIVIGLLLLCGCSSAPSRTVDDVISDARGDVELLSPSLRKTGEEFVAPFEARGLEFAGVPSIHCRRGGIRSHTYKSPDGTRKRDFETRAYELQAVESVYRYRVEKVESIVRTGTADRPFLGTVAVEIEMIERKSESVRREVKEAVPPGWTRLDDAENEVAVVAAASEVRRTGPLPLPPIPAPLPLDLPALDRHELDAAAQQAVDACLRSAPSGTTSRVYLKFFLDANTKTWVR